MNIVLLVFMNVVDLQPTKLRNHIKIHSECSALFIQLILGMINLL